MFPIIKQPEEIILIFSQGTVREFNVRVLQNYFALM